MPWEGWLRRRRVYHRIRWTSTQGGVVPSLCDLRVIVVTVSDAVYLTRGRRTYPQVVDPAEIVETWGRCSSGARSLRSRNGRLRGRSCDGRIELRRIRLGDTAASETHLGLRALSYRISEELGIWPDYRKSLQRNLLRPRLRSRESASSDSLRRSEDEIRTGSVRSDCSDSGLAMADESSGSWPARVCRPADRSGAREDAVP